MNKKLYNIATRKRTRGSAAACAAPAAASTSKPEGLGPDHIPRRRQITRLRRVTFRRQVQICGVVAEQGDAAGSVTQVSILY